MLKYIKYNVNPKHRKVGDCSTRALAVCLSISYEDALRLQYEEAAKSYYGITDRQVIEGVLKHFGYEKQKQPRKDDNTKFLVKELDKVLFKCEKENGVIANVANHFVAIKGDSYIDIWDCGYKTCGNYYSKSLEEDEIAKSIKRVDRIIVPEPEKKKRIRLF